MDKVRFFFQKMMANELFWLIAVFSSLLGFIHLFEKFTHFTGDKIYTLF